MSDTIKLTVTIGDLPNADLEVLAHDLENVIRSHILDEVGTATVVVDPAQPPAIQLLHWRDPDSECEIRAWVDGVQVGDFPLEDIDPGRGYDRDSWNERIAEASNDPTAYGEAIFEALREAGDSEHISGKAHCMEPDDELGFCNLTHGHVGEHNPVPLRAILGTSPAERS